MKEIKFREESASEMSRRLLDEASETSIRDFLYGQLVKDPLLRRRFEVFSKAQEIVLEPYYEQMNAIFRRYDGYVSYQEVSRYYDELDEFFREDLLLLYEQGHYREAFQLSVDLFVKVVKQEMDDSGGESSYLGEALLELWIEIARNADESLIDEMFNWFWDNGLNGSLDYLGEFAIRALFEAIKDPRYLVQKRSYLMKELESTSRTVYFVKLIGGCLLELLKDEGVSIEDVWLHKEIIFKDRMLVHELVDHCVESERYECAVAILLEAIELNDSEQTEYKKRLKDLYRLMKQDDAAFNVLESLVFESNVGNLDSYLEYKACFTDREWPTIRERIFQLLSAKKVGVAIFQAEACFDKVLDYVMEKDSLFYIEPYFEELWNIYPSEMAIKLESVLNEELTWRKGRRDYRDICQLLERIAVLKGGEQMVWKLVERWHKQYKNRPALLDELGKLRRLPFSICEAVEITK